MAKRSTPPPKRAANIPAADVPDAIAKLERRLRDFEGAKPEAHDGNLYDLFESLCHKLDGTLADVFGADTLDFDRWHVSRNEFSVGYIPFGGNSIPRHEYIEAFNGARATAISRLNAAIELLRERLEPAESGVAKVLRAYDGLELHADIAAAVNDLYHGGHYANAIEDAVKALNDRVRLRSGLPEDGATLMQRAFGGADPVLRFNDFADQFDKDEQQGFMMMFWGAVAGLRNPRAHKLIKDDPERALEFIAFVSLLAKLLDGATKRRLAGRTS